MLKTHWTDSSVRDTQQQNWCQNFWFPIEITVCISTVSTLKILILRVLLWHVINYSIDQKFWKKKRRKLSKRERRQRDRQMNTMTERHSDRNKQRRAKLSCWTPGREQSSCSLQHLCVDISDFFSWPLSLWADSLWVMSFIYILWWNRMATMTGFSKVSPKSTLNPLLFCLKHKTCMVNVCLQIL